MRGKLRKNNSCSKVRGPSKSDYHKQNRTAKNWRNIASKADDRVAERMIRSHARKSTYKTYKPGDKVFVKMSEKRGRSIRKYRVLPGKILKRFKDDATYKVKFLIPGLGSPITQKIRVEDIADYPSESVSSRREQKIYRKQFLKKSVFL